MSQPHPQSCAALIELWRAVECPSESGTPGPVAPVYKRDPSPSLLTPGTERCPIRIHAEAGVCGGVKTTRLIIAEDHEIIRAGIRTLVESGTEFSVVGEARNGIEATAMALQRRPDIALLDVKMPGMDGFAAARHIAAGQPEVKIVMVTIDDSAKAEKQARNAGAVAIVTKDECAGTLVDTLRRVVAGNQPAPPLSPDPSSEAR